MRVKVKASCFIVQLMHSII